MAHYMVELPNGVTMPMNDEALEAYRNGTWDPTKLPELTPEEEAEQEARVKRAIDRIFRKKDK